MYIWPIPIHRENIYAYTFFYKVILCLTAHIVKYIIHVLCIVTPSMLERKPKLL